VLRLLPPGYAPDACVPADPPDSDALAAVSCGSTEDGGPVTTTYSIFANAGALQSAFDGVIGRVTQQVCPGRIASPGPWRRGTTPDVISGIVFCGDGADTGPVVIWTDDAKLLLSASRSGPGEGPDLAGLYAWWSTHS